MKENTSPDPALLRRHAELTAREEASPSPDDPQALSPEQTRQTLHELSVHQVELELQNEELRRTQADLVAAKTRYSDLYDQAPVGYLTLGEHEHGLILEANLTATTLLGGIRSALIGQRLSRFIHSEHQDACFLFLRQLSAIGKPRGCELRLVPPHGPAFWAHLEGTVATDAVGATVNRVTLTDVTERKQAAAALIESGANFRTFFESMTDLIFVGTPEGRMLFTNRAVSRTLGYTTEELATMHLLQVHPADKRQEVEDILGAMSRGERESCLLPLARKDGGLVPVETRVWFGKWNGADCLFGIAKNLTAEQEAQQRFERLFRNNPAPMALSLLPEQRFFDVNNAFLNTLGYAKGEVIGRTVGELNMFPDPEQQAALADKLQAATHITGFELQVRRADGKLLSGLFSGELIQSQGREYFLTVMIDITARKQAEAALAFNLILLGAQQEASLDGILVVNDQGKIVSFNQRFVDLWGIPPEVIASGSDERTLQSVLDKLADPDAFLREVARLYAAPLEACRDEIVLKDGRIFDRYSTSLLGAEGQYHARLWYFREATEQRRAAAALRESEARLRAITDSAQDAILMMDSEGRVSYWNPAAERMLGYARAEAIGQNLHEFVVPPRYHAAHHAAFPVFQQTGQGAAVGKTLDLEARRKDGTEISVRLSLSTVLVSGRWHAVGLLRDVTERKRAEESAVKTQRWLHGISQLQQSLLVAAPLAERLRLVTDAVVRWFDADFCRVWLIRPGDLCAQGCVHAAVQDGSPVCRQHDRCLHLLTSSGRYTHTDGQGHRRVPFGAYKIGRVASGEEHKFVTNEAQNDPRIHDRAWVRELGLVSFAGYQLRPPGEAALGVLSLFAKHPIGADEDAALEGLASMVALVVKQALAEESLQRSELKFRTLFDSMADAVMLLDETGFFDCNPATLAMFGCATREEFLTKHPADLSPPQQPDGGDSRTLAQARITAALATGRQHFEWTHRRADTGASFPAEVTATAMQLEGRPMLQAVVRDLTEREQAEIEHAAIIATALDGFYMSNLEGRILEVNDAYCRMSGYSRAELLALRLTDLEAKETSVDIQRHVEKIVAEGQGQFETTHRRQDGSVFQVAASVQFSPARGGVLLAFMQDITARLQAEAARREAECFTRATIDALPDQLCVLDATGAIVTTNRAWDDFAAANALPTPTSGGAANYLAVCDAVVGPETAEATAFGAGLRAVLQGEREEFALEYPCHSPTEQRWFVGRATRFAGTGPVRVVVTHQNVTIRKQAAVAQQAAKEAAEAATRSKSEFLANMSHEIRTPMNAIIGLTHLAADTTLTPQQQSYVTNIGQAAQSLLGIINDILDFSKVEAGKLALATTDFALEDILSQVLSLQAEQVGGKPLELHRRMARDVPTRLWGDPQRLTQILSNLLSNAVKFTAAGDIVLAVKVADTLDMNEGSGTGVSPVSFESHGRDAKCHKDLKAGFEVFGG